MKNLMLGMIFLFMMACGQGTPALKAEIEELRKHSEELKEFAEIKEVEALRNAYMAQEHAKEAMKQVEAANKQM